MTSQSVTRFLTPFSNSGIPDPSFKSLNTRKNYFRLSMPSNCSRRIAVLQEAILRREMLLFCTYSPVPNYRCGSTSKVWLVKFV